MMHHCTLNPPSPTEEDGRAGGRAGEPGTESGRLSPCESGWISICSSHARLLLARGTCGLSELLCVEVNAVI